MSRIFLPFAIATILLITACGVSTTAAQITATTTPSVVRVNISTLGDSISQGWGTKNAPVDKFPMQIRIANRSVSVNDQAMGGYTVKQMMAYVPAALATHPDYVLIELGTNDERDSHTLAQFQTDYTALLSALHSVPHIGCLSIWPSPGNEANVGAFNSVIQQVCGANYIAISDLATPANETLPENWHPNTQGALAIADTVSAWIARGYHN